MDFINKKGGEILHWDMEGKLKEQWRSIKLKRMGGISNVHNKIMSNKIFPISTLKMKINNK